MADFVGKLKALFGCLLQDLDSYVVIAAAISLAAAAAAGVKLGSYLSNITIALLALISLSLVRTRYRFQAAKPLPVTPSDVLMWRDNVVEIEQLIDASDEVWLWGAALTEHIPMLGATLRRGVARGLKAKVLLIQPNSASLRMLAFRAVSPPSNPGNPSTNEIYLNSLDEMAGSMNRKLLLNIDSLEEIRRSIPAEYLQYRTMDYLAPYVIYAFDPRLPQGRIVVRLGFHDGNNNERPTLWLSRQTDAAWFEHFMHQLETAWSAASVMNKAGGWSADWL